MANKFFWEVDSPDGKHFEDQAELLSLTLSDGDIGIMKGHLPLIGIIQISHFKYLKDGKTTEYAIGGGVLNIKKDKIIILADSFESKAEIDKKRAEEAKKRAENRIEEAKKSKSRAEIDVKRAETALRRALNRLSLTD